MYLTKPVFFFLVLLITVSTVHAQRKFSVKFSLDACLKSKKFDFTYYDGSYSDKSIKIKKAKVVRKNGNYYVTGEHYYEYAMLVITEKIGNKPVQIRAFWVGTKPANIQYINCDTTKLSDLSKNYNLTNAIDFALYDQKFNTYRDKQEVSLWLKIFSDSLQKRLEMGDTSVLSSSENIKKITLKKKLMFNQMFAYFKSHTNEYYS